MASELNQYPGRVKIKSVKIAKPERGVDVTSFFIEFNTDVSVNDSTMDCELLVLDAKNLLTNFPITSGDRVQVELQYVDDTKIIEFRIVKIDRIRNDDNQRAYVLHGVSEIKFRSFFEIVQGSFKGTFSDIAKEIFKNHTHEKFGIWEQSTMNTTVVIPKWNPVAAISWCAKKAQSATDTVRMRFFQDSKGTYHFTSLEKFLELYKDNPPQKYRYFGNVEASESAGNQTPNSAGVMENVLDMEIPDSFNIHRALTEGRLKATNNTWDYTNKTRETIQYDYWENFRRENYANPFPQWSREDYGGGRVINTPFTSDTHESGLYKHNDQSNLKLTSLDKTQQLMIVVKGNSAVEIGQLIEFEMPAAEPQNDEQVDKRDIRWSGKYYVVEKRDLYQRDGHQMALTISKESQIMDLMK